MDKSEKKEIIILPAKERTRILYREIRALYKEGYSMDEICKLKEVSKTTVFFAVRGRSKKNVVSK